VEREEGWTILCEYTKTDALRRHAIAVEAVMRAAARKHGGDEETWGLVGLLHDFDYEQFPSEHPGKGKVILEEIAVPSEIIYAIQCHANFTGYERRSLMDKMIFAVDELSGFVTACALVRPNKSLSELEPANVRKKLKDKSFARSVIREDIWSGIDELGVDFDEHVRFVVEALKPVADQIGLNP
jgi:putative nucleotidyltransferase with HDIG domain